MSYRAGLFIPLMVLLVPRVGWGQEERERLLVLDFEATEGVQEALLNVANDTFISTLTDIGRFDLATSADLRMMLETENQRQLLECADDSCLAEIAGAFGAKYLSRGRLSLLDDDVVLTLQLFDSQAAAVDKQLTRTVPSRSEPLRSTVEGMTYELLELETVPEADPWYENRWLWLGAGVVVIGGLTAVLLQSAGDDGDPNLGRFTFDG